MTEDQMLEWCHWLNGHEFQQILGNGEVEGSLTCCSPWGHKELDTTEQVNNINDQTKHRGLQGNENILYEITMLAIYHYTFVQAH